MTSTTTAVVKYDGTDVGRVYLRDVGGRNQMGNGRGIFSYGQDRYISYGQDATFLNTGEVILSKDRGVIKKFVTYGSFHITEV